LASCISCHRLRHPLVDFILQGQNSRTGEQFYDVDDGDLSKDLQTCEYQDIHAMWEILAG
jgi:hypothetical protein